MAALDLSALDEDQRAAVEAPLGPVCILAGAGTGKTRTITHRIHHLIDTGFVQPRKILAVTFTRRAAEEMRQRLAVMGTPGVQTRTFHSAALKQLQYFWPQVAGNLPWRLIDNKFPIVGQAVRKVGLDGSKETVRDVLGEIEWAKSTLVTPQSYEAALKTHHRTPPANPEKISLAYRVYEDLKSQPDAMLLDFDDVLLHTVGAIENSRAVAEEFRAQYRSFVVDEYQDVTPLQQRVLDAWLGDRDDLTVVGDANQTIYSFTGATPDYLVNFSRKYDHATVVRLQRDYRSTPQVVDLANRVIAQASGRIAASKLQLIGQRDTGPEPGFTEYPDEPTEARLVAMQIKRLIDAGTRPSEIAVLYRINAQSAHIEQALAEAGIAYNVHGGDGFYQRPEIRESISALTRAARKPLANKATGAQLRDLIRKDLTTLGLSDKEPEGAEARERWQSLTAFFHMCEDIIHVHPQVTIQGLLGQVRTRQEAQHTPAIEEVTLASLHAAKGLEWDAVFIIGLVDGNLPIQHALKKGDTSEAVEEERRLLYVGITRARMKLELSWALARQEGGRASRRRSRFFDQLEINVLGSQSDTAASSRRKRKGTTKVCSQCRKPLSTNEEVALGTCEDCESPVDVELFELLRAWRIETARAMSVPAFVVLTDVSLKAIAAFQPTEVGQLLEIPGIGPAKVEHYGDEVLAIVSAHTGHVG